MKTKRDIDWQHYLFNRNNTLLRGISGFHLFVVLFFLSNCSGETQPNFSEVDFITSVLQESLLNELVDIYPSLFLEEEEQKGGVDRERHTLTICDCFISDLPPQAEIVVTNHRQSLLSEIDAYEEQLHTVVNEFSESGNFDELYRVALLKAFGNLGKTPVTNAWDELFRYESHLCEKAAEYWTYRKQQCRSTSSNSFDELHEDRQHLAESHAFLINDVMGERSSNVRDEECIRKEDLCNDNSHSQDDSIANDMESDKSDYIRSEHADLSAVRKELREMLKQNVKQNEDMYARLTEINKIVFSMIAHKPLQVDPLTEWKDLVDRMYEFEQEFYFEDFDEEIVGYYNDDDTAADANDSDGDNNEDGEDESNIDINDLIFQEEAEPKDVTD